MKRAILLIAVAVIAAIPVTTNAWVRTYGGEFHDAGSCVQQIVDDNYLVTGFTEPLDSIFPGLPEIWLLKTDTQGDTVWTHKIEWGPLIGPLVSFLTADDGYMIFGGSNWPNIFIIRTDSAGNELWSRNYMDRLLASVQLTADGGYILGQDEDYVGFCSIMKIDSLGDSIWCKKYEFEDIRYVEETTDGGFILTGGARKDGTVWLLKVDSLGDTLWSRTYSNWEESYGNRVRQTSDGGYIVAGSCVVDQEGRLLVIKTDSTDDMKWSYVADYGSLAKCVHETEDGFFVAGRDSDAYKGLLLKFSETGGLLWEQRYGTRTDFHSMDLTNDDGVILTGSINKEGENDDVFLVKTDADGNPAVAERPVTESVKWEVVNSIGRGIVLRYANQPQGFHASVFDASGRKIDEISSTQTSGTITWPVIPTGHSPGVYFILPNLFLPQQAHKVVLVK
ncbi:hypothetical protein JXM67_04710 [candidate division WOR-3 bacterium]|nr:hypothetical protein [candidate division WOR-3 bacterium]